MDKVLRKQAIAFAAAAIATGMVSGQSPVDIARSYEVAARRAAGGDFRKRTLRLSQ